MFRNILVPLDLTDRHARALSTAADLALAGSGEVVLLHVIELIEGTSREEEQDFYARLEETAQEHLQRSGAELASRGVAWRGEVRYGRRELEIVRRAAEGGNDLIVLTAPPVEPGAPVQLGSLSYSVGILAPCPVLLVK
jgi:nucleotide-binding universal stress UspA family protein